MTKNKTFSFEFTYEDGENYIASGYVYDEGIGHYEYWGAPGWDSCEVFELDKIYNVDGYEIEGDQDMVKFINRISDSKMKEAEYEYDVDPDNCPF